MTDDLAQQIASLLNRQNLLDHQYTAAKILENAPRYIYRLGDDGTLIGVVEVKKVQWYQCEIDHLSVDLEKMRAGSGLGTSLVLEAEAKARNLHARIVQCTIRTDNVPSTKLFQKLGYLSSVSFMNQHTHNSVAVYQRTLD